MFDPKECAERFPTARLMEFQNRANRDAVYKLLKAKGIPVNRECGRNQEMHPQYIEDYEGAAKNDVGFGNTSYNTFFRAVYTLISPDFGRTR